MRCLVTGASGHLGSFLVRRLLREGHEVLALVRPESHLWRLAEVLGQTELIRGDLSHPDSLQPLLLERAPEVVFHLAWQGVSKENREDPHQIYTNVQGSLRLFEILSSAGMRTWVGMGSQAEYGPYPGAIREDFPTKPITAYGAAKLALGLLTQKLCEVSKVRYVWFRLFAAYGPEDSELHLIPTVIRELLAGKVPRLTEGEQKWDYLYVDDAIEALYRVAFHSQENGTYNLGSGNVHTIREIVEKIRKRIDPTLKLGFGEIPYRTDELMRLQADISHLQKITNWLPKVELEEGLKRTLEWYQTHPSHENLRLHR